MILYAPGTRTRTRRARSDVASRTDPRVAIVIRKVIVTVIVIVIVIVLVIVIVIIVCARGSRLAILA